MGTLNPQKPKFVGVLQRHYPAILQGALGGSIIGLAIPTLHSLAGKARTQLTASTRAIVVWPPHVWLFLLLILFLSLLLCWQPAVRLCGLLLASWKVDPSGGLFWVWLAASPFALMLASQGHYGSSALLIALSTALSVTFLTWAAARPVLALPSDIDADLPIETPEGDILNRASIVSKLTEGVTAGAASVVALVGAYGDGKTSTLNLLKGVLKKNHRDIVVVSFVSSLATSEDILVGTLFNSIAKELQKRLVYGKLGNALTRYASSLVGFVPKFGDALKELFRVPSQEDQIQELKDTLEILSVRVVVVVDDMDRMQPRELEVLLKLMRGAPEFSNLTYLCAFDKEVLARELAGARMNLDEARRYLEKFFPLQTPLPKIDLTILAREFDTRFEALCKKYDLLRADEERKEFNENFTALWQVHLKSFFSNLRRIKLFFNRITTTIGPIAKEIHLADFILLEIIREVSPDIHDKIYSHRRYFFASEWTIETWPERLHPDDDKERELRKQFLDELLSALDHEQRELIAELLSELFPVVREYRGHVLAGGGDSLASKKTKRIYHPAFFPRYFIFGVQSNAFGEAEFDTLAADLHRCIDVEACKKHFETFFGTLPRDSRRRWYLLDQLATKVEGGRLAPLQAEAVGIALAELSDRLEPPILGMAEAEAARRIIFVVANLLAGSSKVQKFLERVIRASAVDYFATLILAACKDPTKNEILTQWDNVHLDGLEGSFRERMRKRYCEGKEASIFDAANRTGAIRSLEYWARAGGSEEIRSYLADEFERRPQSLGTFLEFMFPMEESSTPSELKALSDLYPLSELEDWLNQHRRMASSTTGEERAIERFRQLLASARMAKLRFKLAEGKVWTAANQDGSALQCVDGQVLPDVNLGEDGLPANRNLRDAVEAGIAEIELPPSWTGSK